MNDPEPEPIFEEIPLTGDFILSYQYNDRDPDTVISLMSEAERDAYYKINRVVEEEGVSETNEFWYFIVAGGVGAILIVVLIVCLCRLKRKNDLIVAKVEKLEQVGDDKTPDGDRNDDFYNSRKSEKQPESAPNRHIMDGVIAVAPDSNQPSSKPKGPNTGEGKVLKMKTADLGKKLDRQPTQSETKTVNRQTSNQGQV